MSQGELNRQVARATGDTVDAIRQMGFHFANEEPREHGPLVIDWDAGLPECLGGVLHPDDWPGFTGPLPSYDEEFDDDLDQEYAHAAA